MKEYLQFAKFINTLLASVLTKVPRHFARGLPGILLLFCALIPVTAQAYFVQNSNTLSAPGSTVNVEVQLNINKIYNVDSVNETYQVDGYLQFIWHDERHQSLNSTRSEIIYEDELASDMMKTDVWVPVFEFKNIQGSQDTQSILLKILPEEGIVIYEERFFGVFHTEMDFTEFPFDEKSFVVEIEPFSYARDGLIFDGVYIFPSDSTAMDSTLGKDWTLLNTRAERDSSVYRNPSGSKLSGVENVFSRAVFEVNAKRNYGYYLWQVLFPLFIIILASFTIFWIQDFGTQIGVGFSLMLTVVAFNFYSATILPKLPYNTFIENVITSGYISISAMIFFAIINHNRLNAVPEKSDLRNVLKIAVPLIYLIMMGIITAYTFL
jgi:hypothetical protein